MKNIKKTDKNEHVPRGRIQTNVMLKAHDGGYHVPIAFILMSAFSASGCASFPRGAIVDAAQASCVIIRQLIKDKGVQEVCATAEELAPYVKGILSSRRTGGMGNAVPSASMSGAPGASSLGSVPPCQSAWPSSVWVPSSGTSNLQLPKQGLSKSKSSEGK